jgi:hypothetical protein
MTRHATVGLIAGLVLSLLGIVARAQSPEFYIVQPDDTLESIAEQFQVDPIRLAQANALSLSGSVMGNQRLYIPDPSLPAPGTLPESDMIKGLYVTFFAIGYPPLWDHAKALLMDSELNAVVIDTKGDRGWVPYNSSVPWAHDVGAQEIITIRDVDVLIEWSRSHDIHTIARIVVFKDNPLALHRPDLAVRDRQTGGPWIDREGLAWVDPFRREVWDYNAALAVEAAELGFNEIQFDYVRFPTDGQIKRAQFSQENTQENRRTAIQEFLARASEALAPYDVTMSVDVFGYTCWRLDDMGIGQVLEDIAPYVDVISPMVYPSTYVGGGGLPGYPEPVPYPYEILYYNVRRAVERTQATNTLIRPWIQDFPDYAYDRRVYSPSEIRDQMRGAHWAGASGWLLWDPRVRYTPEALRPAARARSYHERTGSLRFGFALRPQ